MTVRAYFLLRDGSGGEVVNEPALVPVLRTVPKSPATATAAMKALLAGPSAKERAAVPPIKTLIPAGTKLLGIEITGGLATVDLSAEFASLSPDDAWDLGVFSLRGRLAQVVYTLTQFTTVDRVNFKLEGKPVKELFGMADPEDGTSEEIVLDKPVTRATYRDHYLPLIFVDRPAWGAADPNPGRITGLANVFEAQFRIALLDRNHKVLVDLPVLASCGTDAGVRFDVTLSYACRAPNGGRCGSGTSRSTPASRWPCASIRSISGRHPETARPFLAWRPNGAQDCAVRKSWSGAASARASRTARSA